LATLVALLGSEFLSGCAGLAISSTAAASPSTAREAQLSATPASASFPNVAAGSSSSQTIALTNNGTTAVTVSKVSVTGTGFGTSGLTLPMSLEAGKSTTFNVTFSAASIPSGNISGIISLATSTSGSPLMIGASADVVAAARSLVANPTALTFGNVTLGTESSLSTTLTNTGNANVTVSSISVNGSEFSVGGAGTNLVLAPNQSAALTTTFAPNVAGGASGSIKVLSDASNGVTVSITGTGVPGSPYAVALNWNASTSTVVGYYVYRVTGAGGTYTKLNSAPVTPTEFQDPTVQNGQTYAYVVTAVDDDSNESDYSNAASITIP
jgi:Abnormal spindle-like microcephaly-assoc'd, ASPM-SPD-2-Hydin